MRILTAAAFIVLASPAFAAGDKPFFSLANTDFIVSVSFAIFIGILIYFRVPSLVTGMLDKRAEGITAELNEARELREEAQTLLASYERKHKEVQEQADRIVASAKDEAEKAAAQAKEDIGTSVARRLTGAEEQIAAARAAAVKDIRDQAVTVAIGAANDILTMQIDAKKTNDLIEDAISDVGAKLH